LGLGFGFGFTNFGFGVLAVMEPRDLVSVSRRVSRPVFWRLGLSLEGLRSRLGLEGFWSRSRRISSSSSRDFA